MNARTRYAMYWNDLKSRVSLTYEDILESAALVEHSWNNAYKAVWLLALYDVLQGTPEDRMPVALEIGVRCGITSHDTDLSLNQQLLRWFSSEILPLPVPVKPPLSDWVIWAPMHVFRWIRGAAGDDESICYELRRKFLNDSGDHRWKITLYPPDGSEVYVGYVDGLDEAKARADRAWASWPEEVTP